jgi:hypothetical protein
MSIVFIIYHLMNNIYMSKCTYLIYDSVVKPDRVNFSFDTGKNCCCRSCGIRRLSVDAVSLLGDRNKQIS